MKKMKHVFLLSLLATVLFAGAHAQQQGDPKLTEIWTPVPKIVTPGASSSDAPSDAIVLLGGKDLGQWVSAKDGKAPAEWTLGDGFFTVKKGTGNIQTKRSFTDYQLHIE